MQNQTLKREGDEAHDPGTSGALYVYRHTVQHCAHNGPDNERLYQLSHDMAEYGDAEWIHFTGTGYLLRLNAWQYPVLRLKRLGMSKACRRLITVLCHQYAITSIHFDAAGDVLPGLGVFEW